MKNKNRHGRLKAAV